MATTKADDARQWLQNKAGFARAEELIKREARFLKIDPMSEAALRHALVAFEAETGHKYPRFNPHNKSWRPPAEQEEMF